MTAMGGEAEQGGGVVGMEQKGKGTRGHGQQCCDCRGGYKGVKW